MFLSQKEVNAIICEMSNNLVKGVECYELFGGIALKIHTFSFSFINVDISQRLLAISLTFTDCALSGATMN